MLSPITARNLAGLPGLHHGFFGRAGGVSEGLYSGLNCGFGSQDDPAKVRENRARVALHLGSPHAVVLTPYQIHSADAVIVDVPFSEHEAPRGDALVTATPGLAIGILTADCGPVLFADPVARVVAAAHAGWRGAKSGIIEATLAAMETLGARRGRIHAALGPTISQRNYEVGEDFKSGLIAEHPDAERFFILPPGRDKPHFDLPAFTMADLASRGLASVVDCAQCTYANDSDFFSFRRTTHRSEPDYGRQISAILVA